MKKDTINKLQLVLKVSERCNLNCSYCYYFNGGNMDYINKPAVMRYEVIEKICNDLIQYINDGNRINTVEVIFHGGEATLVKTDKLESFIKKINVTVGSYTRVIYSLQSNGYKLSESFIDLINKYSIGVGFSIDGIQEQHDKYRVTKSGKESYVSIMKNIEKFEAKRLESTPKLGVIMVATSDNDLKKSFIQLSRNESIKSVSILYPDSTYENSSDESSHVDNKLGQSLCECFDVWAEECSNTTGFRNAAELLHALQETKSTDSAILINESDVESKRFMASRMVMIRSDGELYPYDRFLPPSADLIIGLSKNKRSVLTESLTDYLTSNIYEKLDSIAENKPNKCKDCLYNSVCNGGDIQHRFSINNGFNNPSLYCNEIKIFYDYVCNKLVENGYPKHELVSKLENRYLI